MVGGSRMVWANRSRFVAVGVVVAVCASLVAVAATKPKPAAASGVRQVGWSGMVVADRSVTSVGTAPPSSANDHVQQTSFVDENNVATVHYQLDVNHKSQCDGTGTTFVTLHQFDDETLEGRADILLVQLFPDLGNIYTVDTSGGYGFTDHVVTTGPCGGDAYDFPPGPGFGSGSHSSASTRRPHLHRCYRTNGTA